jgi:hypothetical protein
MCLSCGVRMRKVLIALQVSQNVFPKSNRIYSYPYPEGSPVVFSSLSSHAILS